LAVTSALGLLACLPAAVRATSDLELQSAVFRAKPAVVMIGVEARAEAGVRCDGDSPVAVRPAPIRWIGSGAIIHPDGWVVTNGHVVQPVRDANEAELADELLGRAVAEACRDQLARVDGPERARLQRGLVARPANREGLRLEKRLVVNLANGRMYDAEIRAYSPPAYLETGRRRDATGHVQREFGKDVAVLKIDARDLPVVRLARHSAGLRLGQSVFVIGFPGVVATHELLSEATQFEPSVTVGRVSGFKQDIGGHRVIQTDAAIIQGNSGGPVFDERGDVIGAATFTSTQGGVNVQGFNFLIPVETLHEAAAEAGVVPVPDSPFTRLWNRGVDLYVRDLHARAFRHMDAASKIHPGFPDVERVKESCMIKHREQPYLHREEVQWSLAGGGLIAVVAVAWIGLRRLIAAARQAIRQIVRQELERLGSRTTEGVRPTGG
jgi:hypothetical protein